MTERHRGFTLIELMVTIAIVALLALVSAPMALSWVNGARVADARAKLTQGFGKAKALALRNPGQVTGAAAAASLVLDAAGPKLRVCVGGAVRCTATAASLVWQVGLPAGVTITSVPTSGGAAAAWTSLEVDHNGIAAPLVGQFVATKGGQSETFALH
jgi:type IV pilus assembly protein PilA